MRSIIFTILLLSHFTLAAQLQKGNWTIGTGTDVPHFQFRSNGHPFSSYQFSLQPQVGYMLTNRFEIGTGPVVSLYGTRNQAGTSAVVKNRNQSLGWQVYSRYYLKNEGRLIPYLIAGVQYTHTRVSSFSTPGSKYTSGFSQWQFNAGAGLNWFVSPRAALFSELTYSGQWGNGLGYVSGANLNFGFRIFLGKKKQ